MMKFSRPGRYWFRRPALRLRTWARVTGPQGGHRPGVIGLYGDRRRRGLSARGARSPRVLDGSRWECASEAHSPVLAKIRVRELSWLQARAFRPPQRGLHRRMQMLKSLNFYN